MLRRCWWLLLIVSSVAFAQTPRSLFDEGTALYSKGEFASAAVKFEASFAARPVPVTKFNIARSWEQAGETIKAIDAWQAWLAMSPSSPERPAAELSLKTLGEKLARLGVQALTINSLPAGARVTIDGTAAGVVPLTVELTPTRHLIRLDVQGRVPVERTVIVQLDHPVVEFFELAPLDDAAAPVPLAMTRPRPLPSPTVPTPMDAAFAASLSNDTVQVHIETKEKELRLYRANGNPNGECRAPCDAPIARATDVFMIGGAGITPSKTFVLIDHARNGRVSLKVKAGSAGWLVGGGTLFTTVAVAALSIGFAFSISGSGDRTLPVGLGLGLGAASAIGAIVVFATNGTSITFEGE